VPSQDLVVISSLENECRLRIIWLLLGAALLDGGCHGCHVPWQPAKKYPGPLRACRLVPRVRTTSTARVDKIRSLETPRFVALQHDVRRVAGHTTGGGTRPTFPASHIRRAWPSKEACLEPALPAWPRQSETERARARERELFHSRGTWRRHGENGTLSLKTRTRTSILPLLPVVVPYAVQLSAHSHLACRCIS
jgi:hypothetical protein